MAKWSDIWGMKGFSKKQKEKAIRDAAYPWPKKAAKQPLRRQKNASKIVS